ncbi:Aldose reductase [Entamoeba marina]
MSTRVLQYLTNHQIRTDKMNPNHPVPSFILNNGRFIPALGLGTWLSEQKVVGKAVLSALNNGYRHIDCAAIYGNEAEIGEDAFEPFFKEGKVLREEVFITTKLWLDRKDQVRQACEESLKKLHLDYLDLYLIHWPVTLAKGTQWPLTRKEQFDDIPLEQTWREMEKLVEDGLVKSIGISNFTIPQMNELFKFCKIKPVVNQVEFSPYLQQPKLMEFCKEHHIHVTSYSPLGNLGNPDRSNVPSIFENEVMKELSKKYNKTIAQIVLKFVIQKGHSVLAKSTREQRIIENAQVCGWTIEEEDIKKIEPLDKNLRTTDGSSFRGVLGLTHEEFWGEN